MTQRTRDLVTIVAIGLGIALLAMTIANTDRAATWRALRPLAPALPLVLLPGAVWHLLRTLAWRQCFPADSRLRFGRLFRVRLAAEAFSFVTIRGVAGEPLKVIWLAPDVPSMVAAAAVALERAAYLVVTMAFVGVFSAAAMLTIPMPRAWMRVFAWLCGVSLVFAAALVLLMRRRPAPQAQGSPAGPSNVVARFGRQLAIQLRALGECDGRRLAVLAALEAASFGAMVMEVWVVLRLAGTPVSMGGAVTIETFTRAASTASAFIPANLGALEASNVAIAAAMNAAAGAAALAVARRIRGLAWCAAGFLIYPRRPRAAASGGAPVLVAIEDPASPVRVDSHLGGLPIGERICRAASRAGYKSVLVWSLRQTPAWKRIARRLASRLDVVAIDDAERWREYISSLDPDAAVTVLAPGVIASPACLRDALDRALTTNARLPLHVHAEAADSGVFTMMPAALRDPDSMFADECRSTSAVAAWQADAADSRTLRVAADQDRAAGERTLRASIIKPTDGPLARFNRRISIPISVALIRVMRMSAHAMSVGVIALGLYAGWLFSHPA
jgi:hypothetical protein